MGIIPIMLKLNWPQLGKISVSFCPFFLLFLMIGALMSGIKAIRDRYIDSISYGGVVEHKGFDAIVKGIFFVILSVIMIYVAIHLIFIW